MRKFLVLCLTVGLMLGVLTQATPSSAVANHVGGATLSCTAVAVDIEYDVDRDNTGMGREAHDLIVRDGQGTVLWSIEWEDTVPYHYHDVINSSYLVAPQYNPITFVHVSYAGNGYGQQNLYRTTYECLGLPWATGGDMVYIPSTAVVGSFVATTPIYYNPSADAVTTIVMEAGKTAWVYGVDASGMYYKVMLSGKFFWVPVSTMGPNYDAVWNGTPLPTGVVN